MLEDTYASDLAPSFLSRRCLDLPDNLTFEQWAAIGSTLRNAQQSLMWELGDWLLYGEKKKWGEKYDQAIATTGYDYGTLRNAKSVAKRFPLSRRRDKLTFTHHQEVASLADKDAERLLDQAEAEHLSRNDLRIRVAQVKAANTHVKRPRTCGERQIRARLICGNALDELRKLDDNAIDACLCDPPYGMGMAAWDAELPSSEVWLEVYRVLKPGAWCLAFSSAQSYHGLTSSVEAAGFCIQDMGEWIVTTKMAKTNRLKPAHEPFCIAQKPYEQSLDYNEQKWGVGRINIEDARIPWDKKPPSWVAGGIFRRTFGGEGNTTGSHTTYGTQDANPNGRYPSNVVGYLDEDHLKFFFAPRVSREEKGYYNDHPTTKPIALMEWLVKIYSPRGSTVLDPFMGSGSTGLAAVRSGRSFIGIDLSFHYVDIARLRLEQELSIGTWSGQLEDLD